MPEATGDQALPAQNPLARKLKKVLETRLENEKETVDALRTLSTFFTENSLRTRRNLRNDIEKRSVALNEEFILIFSEVKEKVESLSDDVQNMSDMCDGMSGQLKTVKAKTQDLISQTTKLKAKSHELEVKSKIAKSFVNRFQLTQKDIEALKGTNGALQEEFFVALDRVKHIHDDCKLLLRSNQQTVGLEIMEQMALQQEAAYERLYRWTQSECRLMNAETPEISPMLCRAMEALESRPVLLKYSLDEYASARKSAVGRAFIDALTRQGSGSGRPIELSSHDPWRYVGDMLAWIHQAVASEKEYFLILAKKLTLAGLDEEVRRALGLVTEGLCRPFKVRIDQVLTSQDETVTFYKLATILKFYKGLMSHVISHQCALIATIDELHNLSLSLFFHSLNKHAGKLLERVELPPNELGPPESLRMTLNLLREILESQDASLIAPEERKAIYAQIVENIVDPLVNFCTMSATNLPPVEMAVYLINCVHAIETTLALFEFTDRKMEMLSAQIDAHVDTVVSEQASFVLQKCDLLHRYTAIQQHSPEQGPLSRMEQTDGSAMKASMVKFDSFLASPDSLYIPQLSAILRVSLRDRIKRQSMQLICEAYRSIYRAMTDASNAYPNPAGIVPRTPEQVVQLLS